MLIQEIKDSIYIDHIVLTVANLDVSKEFYSKILGDNEYEDEESVMYFVGNTKLFLVQQQDKTFQSKFNPQQIGLEHLAFGINDISILKNVSDDLTTNNIKHSGIHIDKHSGKEKIWLDDPSGIRIEFFIR
ncbi:MAG TPA: VOC family protein [Puia sp.]|nr:VOC family protein [Puia sp.]